jgi:Tol biopolymer transport system component
MLGSYRIEQLIGAGGMGEVYRARDLKLARDVALKVLPGVFTNDPGRLARFEREAQVLAALNESNIAAIYGLEKVGDVDFLVLELVDGETLAERLQKGGPLPLTRALDIARQVAAALESAHAKGIVHRDLKPANIKVTSRGIVKVLDFGLAKASESPEGEHAPVQPVTMIDARTLAGSIMGTPGYMSPEQASGKDVDYRTDVWAFGCLLYELLTSRRAFPPESAERTNALVSQREPDWEALPAKTPSRIRSLIRECLQRDPGARLNSIASARRTIEQAERGWNSWRAAAIAAGIVVVGVGWVTFRLIEQQRAAIRPPVITRLTADVGLTAYPALSSDGTLLAYSSDRASDGNLDIWVQQVSGGNPIRLTTNAADDSEPSFSPDGQRIVFRSEREGGGIYVVPALGGTARRIADLGRTPRFSPDGKWIAYWVGDPSYFGRRHVFIIPAEGGTSRELQPDFYFATHPVWSPDSEHVLFRGARDDKETAAQGFDWWVASIDGGPAIKTGASQLPLRQLIPATECSQLLTGFGAEPGGWVGDWIYFSASSGTAGLCGSLWRVSISSSYHVKEPVQRITSGTENEIQPSSVGGRIAFASVTQNENIWSLPVDANTGAVVGGLQRLTSTAAADVLPVSSSDGRKIAYASSRAGGGDLHIWIKDVNAATEISLPTTSGNELPWLLTADGTELVYCAFSSPKSSENGCYIGPSDGRAARKFCDAESRQTDCPVSGVLDWFDHERQILYKKGLTAETQLVLRDITTGRETILLRYPKYSATAARFSPDGRWISFQVVIDVATRRRIFVAPVRDGLAGSEQEWIPITDGSGLDRNAVWSPDGNLLYFLSERDGFRCFWAQRLDSVSKRPVGPAFPVQHFHQARLSIMPAQEVARIGMSVTRDKIIFSMTETRGNIWLASLDSVR